MTFSQGLLAALAHAFSTLHGEWLVKMECTVATIAQEDLKDLVFTNEVIGFMEEVRTSPNKNMRPDLG